MRSRFRDAMIVSVTAAVVAILCLSGTRTSGQAQAPQLKRVAGKPDFSGIWQANNEANWDLLSHPARAAILMQAGVHPLAPVPAAPSLAFGATGGVPGSLGVVDGDQIPYKPEAAKQKKENAEQWFDRDPEIKCYLPGIPRAMYLPYPFQIFQGTSKVQMVYEFANAARTIHMDTVDPPPDDTWMGHSVGRWEGDTLVVTVTNFNDKTWLSRAGDFHSDALHLVERFTPIGNDAIRYEVTVEDPSVFTRPWKMTMPLYRRLEPNAQLLDYRCTDMVEERLYGHLRKQQLVKRWEGQDMIIDITRRVPPPDILYRR